jgi:hypothetical protein
VLALTVHLERDELAELDPLGIARRLGKRLDLGVQARDGRRSRDHAAQQRLLVIRALDGELHLAGECVDAGVQRIVPGSQEVDHRLVARHRRSEADRHHGRLLREVLEDPPVLANGASSRQRLSTGVADDRRDLAVGDQSRAGRRLDRVVGGEDAVDVDLSCHRPRSIDASASDCGCGCCCRDRHRRHRPRRRGRPSP